MKNQWKCISIKAFEVKILSSYSIFKIIFAIETHDKV